MANTTVFWSVILLSGTPPTDHSIGPFIRMFLFFIMALITSIDFLTAAKAEPSITLRVVTTPSSLWEFGAGL
jgi:hypothetical protein